MAKVIWIVIRSLSWLPLKEIVLLFTDSWYCNNILQAPQFPIFTMEIFAYQHNCLFCFVIALLREHSAERAFDFCRCFSTNRIESASQAKCTIAKFDI